MSKIQADTISCLQCGDVIPLDNAIEIQDDFLCPDCAETHTTVCHNCDERIWQDDDCGDNDIVLCEYCRDNNYVICADYGSLLHQSYAHYEEEDEDGDSPYCLECFQQLEKRSIHSYSYKPEPIFWGQGERYFGVELEVDEGGQDSRNARNILDILNQEKERGYIKSDGSLNDGMELVLHPMSLDFHLEEMPWREVLEEFRNLGYYSHLTDTCGLHVHVNRSSLGKTQEEQESTIANILYFFERFWEEMLRFSRRTERQVRKWAARYGIESTGKLILEKAKKGFAGRYTCVNLTNYDTIEFRIFRGTLKLNTILATLQLIEEICSVALYLPAEEWQALSWTDHMLRLDPEKVPQLIQYLKERRLYVNEPVTQEEEE